MRAPEGFGKNYFSLRAIQAYATTPVLHATATRYACTALHSDAQRESDAPPDDPCEAQLQNCTIQEPEQQGLQPLLTCLFHRKPCHCNRLFRQRTLLLLKLVRTLPECTCKCRFFSFRRTGTHPPHILSLP